ncbi:MAG: hypothetical protein R3F30_02405 [Planctomycetota bacterium]
MLMLQMMQQLMELKSQASAPAPAGGDSEATLASRLDAIVGSLDKKLESFGKKIGVSSAVDSDVDMTSLFERASTSSSSRTWTTSRSRPRRAAASGPTWSG